MRLRSTFPILLILCTLLLAACRPEQDLPGPAATATARPARTPTAPSGPTPAAHPVAPTVRASALPAIDPKNLRGVKILFWHPWSGDVARQVSELVDSFNHENVWGITVTVHGPGSGGALFQDMAGALKNGGAPAVVAAPLDNLRSWQSSGKVVDLNGYVSSVDWGLSSKEIEDFFPVFWNQDAFGGARLGIPAERDTRVLFYNTTWAKALGFNRPPTTPDEMMLQACAGLKANTTDGLKANDGTGGYIIDGDSQALMSWIAAFGGSAENGETYRFNTSQTAKAFQFLRKMFDQGCAWNSRLPLPYEYFATRAALFYSGSLTDIAVQEHVTAQLNEDDSWQILAFRSTGGDPVVLAGGPSYAILRSTPEQELASWLFIRWMILPRNQIKMVESSHTFPLSASARKGLSELAARSPHWAGAMDLLPSVSPATSLPDWWLARSVLEDAGWQLLQPQPTPLAVPKVLQQLDDTIPDVLKHQP